MKTFKVSYRYITSDNPPEVVWFPTTLWLEGKTRNVTSKMAAFEYLNTPGAVLHRVIRVTEVST